jgi:enoyl-CoA hydratase
MTATIDVSTPFAGCCRIALARPDALNAFSYAMYREFTSALDALRYDPKVHVVILTGQGRAFCAGHDTRNPGEADWTPDDLGKAYRSRMLLGEINRLPIAMRSLPQPIIAAVNGAAAGLGFALAVAADIAIAGRSAKFVNALHNAGTGHEIGLSYMLPRAIGTQRAAELLLSSRPVLSDEAERIGLVLRAVDDDKLEQEAEALARSIAENAPIGVYLTKQSLWLNQDVGSLEAAIEMESRAVFMAQTTEDVAEKRAAFLAKRKPRFSGR